MGHLGDYAALITSIAALLTSIAIFRSARSTHRIVNQQRTDMMLELEKMRTIFQEARITLPTPEADKR